MANFAAVGEMATSASLLDRIAGCAAQEGVENPRAWVYDNAWKLVAHDATWADSWAYAVETATSNQNPNTGARGDVISDLMILGIVQANIPEPNPA